VLLLVLANAALITSVLGVTMALFHIQADADWKGLEAYITLMAAVADKIPPAENAVGTSRHITCDTGLGPRHGLIQDAAPHAVPALMSHAHMLSTAPETAMAIRQACLLLIGNLARWIEGHPDYLPTLLQLCCAALQVWLRRNGLWRLSWARCCCCWGSR
jgi:hypothetical protein